MPKKNFLNNLVGTGWTRDDEKRRDREKRSGSSSSSKWHEKSCSQCGATIKYHEDWEHIPSVCSSCKASSKEERHSNSRERHSDSTWQEKRCNKCGTSIRYNTKWANIPDYCEDCKRREFEKPCSTDGCGNTIRYKLHYRDVLDVCGHCKKMIEQGAEKGRCIDCGGLLWIPRGKNYKRCKACSENNKRTKPCKNPSCNNTIEYYPNDEKQYDYCRDCTAWQEKPCQSKGCSNMVRYKAMWEHHPNFCPDCKNKQKPRITAGDIYRAGLVPKGWQHAGKVDIEDGHATMYFPDKGTNGGGYRVSWDGFGEPHWTDEGLPKGHPDRHRDPRK